MEEEAAEETREEAEAVEETLEEGHQCLDLEERDKWRPYHLLWTTSYSDKALTYSQGISERPEIGRASCRERVCSTV